MEKELNSESKGIITNEDKEEAIKRNLGYDAKMIGLDDTFDFQCQQCGQCCMNRQDIILNPFDIYQIAKHENEEPKEIMKKYLIADLGRESRIPMVLLNCDMEPNHWCPFLKFDAADGCKFKCTIHDCSPGACQNHPIGVMMACEKGKKDAELTFCKVDQCGNSKGHNNPVTVRDWVQRYLDNKDNIDAAHYIQTLSPRYLHADDFMMVASYLDRKIKKALENPPEDVTQEEIKHMEKISTMVNNTISIFTNGTVDIGYLSYDINKPFLEQAKTNASELEEMYTHIRDMFDVFKKILEIPEDEKNIKAWVLHDAIDNGILEESNLPKEFIDMVKNRIQKGEL